MSSRLRIFLEVSALISSDLAQIRIENALWRSRKHVVSWCSQSDINIDNYYSRYERYIGHCLCIYSPLWNDYVLRPSFWIADWIGYDGTYNSYYQPRISTGLFLALPLVVLAVFGALAWHIEAETKWPPFTRRHCQMHFLE